MRREWKTKCISALLCTLGAAGLLAGCGGGGGGGTTASVSIGSTSVTPTEVSPGGTVAIQADATGTSAITGVSAMVTKPDRSTVGPVSMSLKTGTSNTYVATYGGTAGQLDAIGIYSVVITATDGTRSANTGQLKFELGGPPPPP